MNWSQATRQPTTREVRQFAVLCSVCFGGLAAWQFADGGRFIGFMCVIIALAVAPVGVWKPSMLRPVYMGWMVLVFPIAWSVSNLILAAVYLGMVVPIGVAFRFARGMFLDFGTILIVSPIGS